MFEVSVSTNGLEFSEVAEKISGTLKQMLVERLVDVAFASAFWGAPVRTGYLASTVYREVGFGVGKVGAGASYAVYVEKGTAPHEIRPINGRVLAFMAGGKMVFSALVHHPGTRANPFMERAADEARGKVDEVFAALWLDVVGG